MTIHELLQAAFQAGVERGRIPPDHVDFNTITFERWYQENQYEIDSAFERGILAERQCQ